MPRRGDNIYKRKDNRWEGRYSCGYTSEGKTKYHSVYGKTYSEVKEKMHDIQQKRQNSFNDIGMTVKVLFDEWLLSISSSAKESTIENYKMKIRKHLLPDFGGMKFGMLNTKTIQSYVQRKLKSGLSARYVADILVVFKSMAKYVSREYNCYNPLLNIKLPKASKKSCIRILNAGKWIDTANTADGISSGEAGLQTFGFVCEWDSQSQNSLGDVTLDGIINGSDATLTLSAYTIISSGGTSPLNDIQTKAADVDKDGIITGSDATLILRYYTMLSSMTSGGNIPSFEEWFASL